ncbi:DUF3748 domain-containing protein [Zavarzinella formosa]|uniref:DUF3748 domain-containing protein n=1 Tax=Zavarzinella formosa TaxID=360055 RepID=UPI0002FEE345|nr:DUF3748 domain-containing protein [Zavarzinella formosa]
MTTPKERQITNAPHGHILTNVNVWSPDSKRIVYDVRPDAAGSQFDGDRIETVDVDTGEVKIVYTSRNGAKCGVATYHPTLNRVIFILGPENPTHDFQYGFARRQGVMVDESSPEVVINLDARDLTLPFTPGALRGGSHVHVFSPDSRAISFTYEDQILSGISEEKDGREINQRNVGVSLLEEPVRVPKTHPRNHDGEAFTVLISRTVANPKPGSDEIKKAYEEGWIIRDGKRSLAFLGDTVDENGNTVPEIFIADLPDDLTQPGDRPIQGTAITRPAPPRGVSQRRLTHNAFAETKGLPRFWLRASPDGSQIAFLKRDSLDVAQIWTISPDRGRLRQITAIETGVRSCFTWSPYGERIAYQTLNAIAIVTVDTGRTTLIPVDVSNGFQLRPEAVVFSPDGTKIAYVKHQDGKFNQIFVCDVPE